MSPGILLSGHNIWFKWKFSISNQLSAEKCNKLFDALFFPISLYSFEVWGTYDRTDAKKWWKDLLEKIHTQFYKHFIGLNIRATIIICRNEGGRLSLKSHININVIKFWLPLVNLPDTSIASKCLLLSNQMEDRLSCCPFTGNHELHCSTRILVEPKLVTSKLPKIK